MHKLEAKKCESTETLLDKFTSKSHSHGVEITAKESINYGECLVTFVYREPALSPQFMLDWQKMQCIGFGCQ